MTYGEWKVANLSFKSVECSGEKCERLHTQSFVGCGWFWWRWRRHWLWQLRWWFFGRVGRAVAAAVATATTTVGWKMYEALWEWGGDAEYKYIQTGCGVTWEEEICINAVWGKGSILTNRYYSLFVWLYFAFTQIRHTHALMPTKVLCVCNKYYIVCLG